MIEPKRNVGPQHWNARLTTAQVIEIRQRLAQGAGIRALAREYGVSATHILRLRRGQSREKG